MSFWDFFSGHSAEVFSLGSDAFMIFNSVKANNAPMFAMSFSSFLKDGAHFAKIKEITPELADALEPHIEAMSAILMAHAQAL